MHYEISEDGDEVTMLVSGTGDSADALLASFQECQAGQCSCPTDQYERLEAIDVQAGADEIAIRLTPIAGQRLDVADLRACMDYTVARAHAD